MPKSRRREITNWIVDKLKDINGSISSYDPTYTYLSDLSGNVYRKVLTPEDLNDFPTVSVIAEAEVRQYETHASTFAYLEIGLLIYVNQENSSQALQDLTQDIEHVLYHLPENTELGIADINIESITTDEGLLAPLGVCAISCRVFYELEDKGAI